MAQYTPHVNNELVNFLRRVTLEYFRFNQFSPYMGEGPTSIIQRFYELQRGGKQINVPLVEQLKGAGKGKGTLTGNEEAIDDYGCRLFIDPARNAIVTDRDELQKESAKVYRRAGELLSDWGVGLQRDEIIEALMSLPKEAPPANHGSDDGDRINGIRYGVATGPEQNTWHDANKDRILYGSVTGNFVDADHAASLANIDATDDKITGSMLVKLKSMARRASPKIAPVRVSEANNREFYVAFCGTGLFNTLAEDLKSVPNADARPRDVGSNPLFQDGDLLYRGVIVREFPEIDEATENQWSSLLTAGAGGAVRTDPIFLCGRSAIGMPWGQMPRPTERDNTDYQFIDGVGIDMMYGVGKLYKKVPKDGADLKQWGIVTGFAVADEF